MVAATSPILGTGYTSLPQSLFAMEYTPVHIVLQLTKRMYLPNTHVLKQATLFTPTTHFRGEYTCLEQRPSLTRAYTHGGLTGCTIYVHPYNVTTKPPSSRSIQQLHLGYQCYYKANCNVMFASSFSWSSP